MADQLSFSIGLNLDGGNAVSSLQSVGQQLKSQLASLKDAAGKIDLFETLQKSIDDTRQSLKSTTRDIELLRAQLKDADASAIAAIAEKFKLAAREGDNLTRTLAKQETQQQAIAADLLKLGIASNQYTGAQAKLAAQIQLTNEALSLQAAKDTLGLKTMQDVQPRIDQLRASYQQLAASGTLSWGELRQAQALFAEETSKAIAQTNGWAQSFSSLKGELIAMAASVYVISAAAKEAVQAWSDYAQRIAEINSITDMSKSQLDAMGQSVRNLAMEMGTTLADSARALYNILSSGISENNAIKVLADSTRAAVAGLTDVDTTARIGVAVLNAYGLQTNQLTHVFDVLFQTVKDGVVVFPELAQNLGEVLPAARAAGVSLEEIGAAMVVLTRQGIQAPEAVTALTQAIVHLSAPTEEVQQRMRDLGITFNGFMGTIEQLAQKQLSLAQMRSLIPDIRAAKGTLALTQNIHLLNDELQQMDGAADATQRAYEKMKDTPEQNIKRLKASIHDAAISLGEWALGTGSAAKSTAELINQFNALDQATKNSAFSWAGGTLAIVGFSAVVGRLGPTVLKLAGDMARVATGAGEASLAMTTFTRVAGPIGAFLAGLEIGDWAYESSAAVRRFGDELGLAMAGAQNAIMLVGTAMGFTGKSINEASDEFKRNIDILRDQYGEVVLGVAEHVHDLEKRQKQLTQALSETKAEMTKDAGALGDALQTAQAKIDANFTKLQTTIDNLKSALTSTVADLEKESEALITFSTAAAQQIEAQSSLEIEAINRRKAALDSSRLSESQAEAEITKVYTESSAKRLALITQGSLDAVKALGEAEKAKLELVKQSGGNINRAEAEIAANRKNIYAGIVGQYKSMVDALNAEETRHLNAAKTAAEALRSLNNTFAEDQRKLDQADMTESEKRSDDLRQVDVLLYKAKQALRDGDEKAAKTYADEAVSLAKSTAHAVKEGDQEIVSAREAAITASIKLRQAQEILVTLLKNEKSSHEENATAIDKQRVAAEAYLNYWNTELQKLIDKAKETIKINIDADTKAFDQQIKQLRDALADQAVLLPIKAKVDEAQAAYVDLKRNIEKGADMEVRTNLATIKKDTDDIAKVFPGLAASMSDAGKAIDAIGANAGKLGALNAQIEEVGKQLKQAQTDINNLANTDTSSKHTVSDNVPDVQKRIQELTKPTESTHTIHIKEVKDGGGTGTGSGGDSGGGSTGFAKGGPVPAFATGGPVFRRPEPGKVAGLGTGDTVAQRLRAGSYVLNVAAARHYGDMLLSRVAKFESGGSVGGGTQYDDQQTNPKYKQSFNMNVSAPTLPSDPKQANAKIYSFAHQALTDHESQPGQWKTFGDQLAEEVVYWLDYISRTADESAYVGHVLQPARTITLNLRGGADFDADLIGYDIDGRRWHRGPDVTDPTTGMGTKNWEFYALGGMLPRGRDVVPAMLTPGEYVMSPQAVQHFGPDFMAALNARSLPVENLAAAVRYFASGGPVGIPDGEFPGSGMYPNLVSQIEAAHNIMMSYSDKPPSGGTSSFSQNLTLNVQVNGNDLLSEDQIRRKVVPVLSDMMRRAR